MKKVLMALCVCAAALVMANMAMAADVLITDFESGNPFQQWGVPGWQARLQAVVANPEPLIGATGNWLEDGTGGGGEGQLILPHWAAWDFSVTNYNAHSRIEFDAVLFSGVDNMSWPSDTMTVSFNREGSGFAQTPSYAVYNFDVTDLKDSVQHFAIDYSLEDPVQLVDNNDWFQGYMKFYTNTTDGLIYLDNFKFSGDPLPPAPEPTTIVMLALAGLTGLLYWRKR